MVHRLQEQAIYSFTIIIDDGFLIFIPKYVVSVLRAAVFLSRYSGLRANVSKVCL
jgi:hypothetical protein